MLNNSATFLENRIKLITKQVTLNQIITTSDAAAKQMRYIQSNILG
jgi:hypothetical protein